MNRLGLMIISVIILVSCKYEGQEKVKSQGKFTKESKKNNSNNIKIIDSLFIGDHLISSKKFLLNIENGGDNFKYFHQYENILHRMNEKFIKWEYLKDSKVLSINSYLSLELMREKYNKEDKEKNIHIMLYTKIKGVKNDSILFYKYQIDKKALYVGQRFESLSYLQDDLTLWNLKTYTNQSELALGIDNWNKYKIDIKTGKIILIEKLNPYK
ncbi:hypothetical protein NZ698_16375 [Chryseobacterium sp. PBS4-4]|uniref:Lipoprotein n=1 Tax=Chryseobacterium edaphi TaxID=2976532 RepID=A0ABT2W977_9FLAO|nr:hypothetical protein [Chryseobacterium edaphi]MCU7618772.1 hypothetical protein [Chryseobacterium edaphi]